MKFRNLILPLAVGAVFFTLGATPSWVPDTEVGSATIDSIEAAQNDDGTFTVRGTASDTSTDVEGDIVEFSGMDAIEGLTTSVMSDGTFELTVDELETETSTSGQAVIYDLWGNASDVSTFTVTPFSAD